MRNRKEGLCKKCNRIKLITCRELCQTCYTKTVNKEKHDNSPMIPCSDGCGQLLHSISPMGIPVKYIKNHQPYEKDHWNWKGGYTSHGYRYEFAPYHPFANIRRCVRKHRLVYEQYYNVCLLPWIEIHHINEIKDDNRIENLMPVTMSEHMMLREIDMSGRRCSKCGSKYTAKRKQKSGKLRPLWRTDGDGNLLCLKCYNNMHRERRNELQRLLRRRKKQNQLLI